MSVLENAVMNSIKKHLPLIVFVFVTVLSFILRIQQFRVISSDMSLFLIPWMQTIRENGGFAAFKMSIGDYGVQYMTLMAALSYLPFKTTALIKSISIVFDFVGAGAAAYLVSLFTHSKEKRKIVFLSVYGVVLCIPTVWLNSAVWGQCDFMYTSFLLLWLVAFAKEKYTHGVIWFSLAFILKFQTVFFLPALIVFYFVSRRFSALNFLLVPGIYALTSIPAIIAGRPMGEVFSVYVNQIDTYQDLTLNCPNIYYWFPIDFVNFRPLGVLLTFCILAIGCVCYAEHRDSVEKWDIIWFTLWVSFTCVMFLPAMHERYFFPVEILLLVASFIKNRNWLVTVTIISASVICYVAFLFNTSLIISRDILAFFTFGAYAIFTLQHFSELVDTKTLSAADSP